MDEIIRWKPFLASYESYNGYHVTVRFKCPHCGGQNCDRKVKHCKQKVNDRHFWQCHYRCSDCGAEHDKDGEVFYYASDCFIHVKDEVIVQQSLF